MSNDLPFIAIDINTADAHRVSSYDIQWTASTTTIQQRIPGPITHLSLGARNYSLPILVYTFHMVDPREQQEDTLFDGDIATRTCVLIHVFSML